MARPHSQRPYNSPSDPSQGLQDVVVYIMDLSKGSFIYMGSSIFEMTGYLPSFFLKKGFRAFFEILVDADYARIKEKYVTCLWKPRKSQSVAPEIFADVFRIHHKEEGNLWIENTMMILNYSQENVPKKMLGYIRPLEPKQFCELDKKIAALKETVLALTPPEGLASLSGLKNWDPQEKEPRFRKDSLLQIAFQGQIDFKLTKREKEILQYVADGYSARDIADMLFISQSTVVTHRKHLLDKFEVKNVAELIKVASNYFYFN